MFIEKLKEKDKGKLFSAIKEYMTWEKQNCELTYLHDDKNDCYWIIEPDVSSYIKIAKVDDFGIVGDSDSEKVSSKKYDNVEYNLKHARQYFYAYLSSKFSEYSDAFEKNYISECEKKYNDARNELQNAKKNLLENKNELEAKQSFKNAQNEYKKIKKECASKLRKLPKIMKENFAKNAYNECMYYHMG